MEDCCAIRPVGMHKYKANREIESLERQFYGLRENNKDIDELDERAKRYVDKVRRAMNIDFEQS